MALPHGVVAVGGGVVVVAFAMVSIEFEWCLRTRDHEYYELLCWRSPRRSIRDADRVLPKTAQTKSHKRSK